MIHQRRFVNWTLDILREAAWAPLGVFGVYAIGLALHLFRLFPSLDIPVHFAGGVAITYFYRAAIRHSQRLVGEIPFPIQVLFAITCTGTTTVLWEFYENISDFFFSTHMVRGMQDTIMDLFAGLMGALVLSLLYRRRR
jgi:hypothetical protein